MLIKPSRRRFDLKPASELEYPQDLTASSTKYGTWFSGLPDPTTLQFSSFHQVLLQVLKERHFGFHFTKFAGQDFAVLIHTFNIHILHYRHRTCLTVNPHFFQVGHIQNESFILSFSKVGVKGCPADANSLYNKAVEIRHTINETLYINRWFENDCEV